MMPVPLALTEINGLLKSRDKDELQKRLLENIVCTESININGKFSCLLILFNGSQIATKSKAATQPSLLIDGQGLVVSFRITNCKVFGELADHFIKSMLWHGNKFERIDLVFDRFRDHSIKRKYKKSMYQESKSNKKRHFRSGNSGISELSNYFLPVP